MEEYSIFHKVNFLFVSIFVTLVGCSILIGSIFYGLTLLQPFILFIDLMFFSFEFFLRFFLLPLILGILFLYILVKIAFFYFKTARLFNGELDECWEGFSRLIYRDSAVIFLFGLFIMIVSALFTGISEEVGLQTGDNALIESFQYAIICIVLSIFLLFVGNMVYDKNIIGGFILIFRNLIRLICLIILTTMYAFIFSFLPAGSLIFIMIIILLDGITHLVSSCLLVYYELRDNRNSNTNEEDYYSQFGLSTTNEYLREDDLFIENNIPSITLRGEIDEDGFEWVEYPAESENWFWREQYLENWQKY